MTENNVAPFLGPFRFTAMKDDYEKMKTHTSQTTTTPVAAFRSLAFGVPAGSLTNPGTLPGLPWGSRHAAPF